MSETTSLPFSRAIVIGASAGAVDALLQILPALAKGYPFPLMIVVHLPPEPQSTLAPLLAARCQIAVKEAEDKEPLCAGTAYLAPPNYHLLVEPDLSLSLSNEEPVLYSRPSIDVLFESAADALGESLVGLVLTGGNADGARGLQTIAAAGGLALVEDPATAAYPEMPRSALAACPTARFLSLANLAALLQEELPRLAT